MDLKDEKPTYSTLLISGDYLKKYAFLRSLNGKQWARYLHYLLSDPLIGEKMKLLKSNRSKKQYQSAGLNLERVNFVPNPEDWAHLSILSNASGFSRCYVFVYLMLFDLRIYVLPKKNGTPKNIPRIITKNTLSAQISVNHWTGLYRRILRL